MVIFTSTMQDADASRMNLEEKLRNSLVPKYHWLFSQMGRLENGVKFLVDLRADLLVSITIINRMSINCFYFVVNGIH